MTAPVYLTTEKGMKVRILSPSDYDAIISIIRKENMRTLFEVSFWTGLRWVEIQRLHAGRYSVIEDGKKLILPRDDQQIGTRCVAIPQQIAGKIPQFLVNRKPPTGKVWGESLKRWAEWAKIADGDCIGIVPKMMRYSIEVWMIAAGMPLEQICLRQGHDSTRRLKHYQGIKFEDEDVTDIKRRFSEMEMT